MTREKLMVFVLRDLNEASDSLGGVLRTFGDYPSLKITVEDYAGIEQWVYDLDRLLTSVSMHASAACPNL